MNRRAALLGLGGVVAGGGALLGTGAFTTVEADVEHQTAGDSRVCPQCASLQGTRYTIAEARGVVPVHPRCRCAWKPVVED
jgi:hypothetical protein